MGDFFWSAWGWERGIAVCLYELNNVLNLSLLWGFQRDSQSKVRPVSRGDLGSWIESLSLRLIREGGVEWLLFGHKFYSNRVGLVWGISLAFLWGNASARAQQDFDVSVCNASALAEGVRGEGWKAQVLLLHNWVDNQMLISQLLLYEGDSWVYWYFFIWAPLSNALCLTDFWKSLGLPVVFSYRSDFDLDVGVLGWYWVFVWFFFVCLPHFVGQLVRGL